MELSLGPVRETLPLDTRMDPDDLLVTVQVEVYRIPGNLTALRLRLGNTGAMKLSARETRDILQQALNQLREVHGL